MRYPVFVAATVALSVSLASVLTAWLIVATKGGKARVQPEVALVGGARTPVIFLGSPTQGAHLPLPPSTQFIPTRTAGAVMRIKWLSAFGDGSGQVLIVQPGVQASTRPSSCLFRADAVRQTLCTCLKPQQTCLQR
jgi:hypothetical protein